MASKKEDKEKKEEKQAKEEGEKKEEEKEVEVPKHLEKIVKEIEEMKVMDLAKLVEVLEEKLGVSAMPAAVPQAGPAPAAAQQEEEKSAYNVILTGIGGKKISVIKAIKKITKKGLKDCKDLVDAAETEPQTVKENAKKEEAEELKKELEEAGATVKLE